MVFIERWGRWANGHHSYILDGIRVILGIFIFYKGLFFLQNTNVLIAILNPSSEAFNSFWIVHYVAMAHLAGGLFIGVGLLTRLSIVVQFPILLGALWFNINGAGEFTEVIQSILIFIGLSFFMIYGSGKLSADNFLGIGIHD